MAMYTARVIGEVIDRLGKYAVMSTRHNLPDIYDTTEKMGIVDIKRTTLIVDKYQNSFPDFKVVIHQYSNDKRTFGIKEAIAVTKKLYPEFKEAEALNRAIQFGPLDSRFFIPLDDIDRILRWRVSEEKQQGAGQQLFEIRYGYANGAEGCVAFFIKTEQTAVVVQVKLK